MRGAIRRWEAGKGFGFIQAEHSSNVFFHARDYRGDTPPTEGMEVDYEEIQVGGKGPRAMQVRPRSAKAATAARPARPHRPMRGRPAQEHAAAPAGARLAMVLMLTWMALLAWGAWTQRLPLVLLGILALLNGATFFAYALDKSAAQRRVWRTPEQTLHLLALLGGWPAAWWAQQWLRHKSRKESFRAAYWGTVLLHSALLALVVLRPDMLYIQ